MIIIYRKPVLRFFFNGQSKPFSTPAMCYVCRCICIVSLYPRVPKHLNIKNSKSVPIDILSVLDIHP